METALEFLKKAGVYKNNKYGIALMCLWQMLSYGIYGIVAGTKKYFELNSVKKNKAN